MNPRHPRLLREAKTIEAMLAIFCGAHHGRKTGLCPRCEELRLYALERLDRCPFQDKKSTCANCPVHCYKPALREQIRVVMRYAGPRMLLRHPVLTLLHMIDGRRKPPALAGKAAARGDINR